VFHKMKQALQTIMLRAHRSNAMVIGGIAALAAGCAQTGFAEPVSPPPNVVLIFGDDIGYGDRGVYGSQTIDTPHLDALAENGVRFTQFYVSSPVCTPSRGSLLTGRHQVRLGFYGGVTFPDSTTGMSPDEITIAEMLKEQGYATGMFGKWHLGHRPEYLPTRQGFDEWFGGPYSNDMQHFVMMEGDDVVDLDPDQRYLTKNLTERAVDFINRKADQPFFLYLAHHMTHVPVFVSEEFEGKSDGGRYGDAMEEIDWSVGQVLAKLQEHGLTDNTIVIFTSDNGPWLTMGLEGGSAGGLREGKQTTFEGGVRVPAIMSYPAELPQGMVYNQLASSMDMLPTLAGLTGAEAPDDRAIDGVDMSEILKGNQQADPERELAHYRAGVVRAYRKGDWKIKIPAKAKDPQLLEIGWPGAHAGHGWLLFNLSKDPGERVNLANRRPKKLEDMKAALRAFEEQIAPQLPEPLELRGHPVNDVPEAIQPSPWPHLRSRELRAEGIAARRKALAKPAKTSQDSSE